MLPLVRRGWLVPPLGLIHFGRVRKSVEEFPYPALEDEPFTLDRRPMRLAGRVAGKTAEALQVGRAHILRENGERQGREA